jgi:hypothetical protein
LRVANLDSLVKRIHPPKIEIDRPKSLIDRRNSCSRSPPSSFDSPAFGIDCPKFWRHRPKLGVSKPDCGIDGDCLATHVLARELGCDFADSLGTGPKACWNGR